MKPDLSRRQFLVHSAGIAGASIGLGRSPGDRGGAVPPRRFGFIGLGDRGRHLLGALLKARARLSGAPADVVALCDIDPRRLKRALDLVEAAVPPRGRPPRGFTNYRALLDAPEVEAVFIATPVHLHAPQALTALLAGKHVYLEKPMALDVEECRRLLEAAADAERAGRVFQIGLQRRYSQRYRRSIRYIQSGEAGRILFVRAQWHTGAKTVGDKLWMFRREKSGDMVVEQACHQFDVCNWLFGAPPLRACGFGGTLCRDGEPPGRDTMDHYGAVLEYPGGGKVHLSHLTFAVPERRFAGIHELVFCERAGVDLGNALAWNAAGETVELARVPGELARIPGSGGNETSAVAEGGSETQLAVEGFLHAIETGRPPEADARAGAAATLAALLCRRAIESARPVSWSELGAG